MNETKSESEIEREVVTLDKATENLACVLDRLIARLASIVDLTERPVREPNKTGLGIPTQADPVSELGRRIKSMSHAINHTTSRLHTLLEDLAL